MTGRPAVRTTWVVECGTMPYGQAWALQRALVAARQADRIEDTLLLVEHPPVITIGRAGRTANILAPRDLLAARGFEVYETERGGDVTYHGPGQLVGYPIVDLRALDEDVVRYVRLLEVTLIDALGAFGIVAGRMLKSIRNDGLLASKRPASTAPIEGRNSVSSFWPKV